MIARWTGSHCLRRHFLAFLEVVRWERDNVQATLALVRRLLLARVRRRFLFWARETAVECEIKELALTRSEVLVWRVWCAWKERRAQRVRSERGVARVQATCARNACRGVLDTVGAHALHNKTLSVAAERLMARTRRSAMRLHLAAWQEEVQWRGSLARRCAALLARSDRHLLAGALADMQWRLYLKRRCAAVQARSQVWVLAEAFHDLREHCSETSRVSLGLARLSMREVESAKRHVLATLAERVRWSGTVQRALARAVLRGRAVVRGAVGEWRRHAARKGLVGIWAGRVSFAARKSCVRAAWRCWQTLQIDCAERAQRKAAAGLMLARGGRRLVGAAFEGLRERTLSSRLMLRKATKLCLWFTTAVMQRCLAALQQNALQHKAVAARLAVVAERHSSGLLEQAVGEWWDQWRWRKKLRTTCSLHVRALHEFERQRKLSRHFHEWHGAAWCLANWRSKISEMGKRLDRSLQEDMFALLYAAAQDSKLRRSLR